jgi:hypothetical protein
MRVKERQERNKGETVGREVTEVTQAPKRWSAANAAAEVTEATEATERPGCAGPGAGLVHEAGAVMTIWRLSPLPKLAM